MTSSGIEDGVVSLDGGMMREIGVVSLPIGSEYVLSFTYFSTIYLFLTEISRFYMSSMALKQLTSVFIFLQGTIYSISNHLSRKIIAPLT